MADREKLGAVWNSAWPEIKRSLAPHPGGGLAWRDDLLFRTAIAILANSIDWPESSDENYVNKTLYKSIEEIITSNTDDKSSFKKFYETLSRIRAHHQKIRRQTFYYLTRLSIPQNFDTRTIRVDDCDIVIGSAAHAGFSSLEFSEVAQKITALEPSSFCPIALRTRAKSKLEAAEISRRALYAFIGFLNSITSQYTVNFGITASLHRIHTSRYQLIADNRKQISTSIWWFSPYQQDLYLSAKIDPSALTIASEFFSDIKKSKIKNELISSLELIHSAGAELNDGLRALLIWNAVEVLFSDVNSRDRNDTIIHRASFLSDDQNYRKTKLQILNKMRNMYAHRSRTSINADAVFFDTRNYLINAIRFLGKKRWSKFSLKDLHEIFDHSLDPVRIRGDIRKARLALNIRRE